MSYRQESFINLRFQVKLEIRFTRIEYVDESELEGIAWDDRQQMAVWNESGPSAFQESFYKEALQTVVRRMKT